MKTLTVLLLSVFFSCSAFSQAYTRAYAFSKKVNNGTSAYSTGQCLGTLDSLNFYDSAKTIQPLGTWLFLQNVGLVDSIKNDARIDWVIFNQRPAAVTDGSAWTPSYADLKKIVAVIPIGNTYYDGANNSFNDEPQVNRKFIAPTSKYLYYVLVIRATKTWSVASTIWLKPLFFR